MPSRRHSHASLALKSAELAWAAPQVIAMRLTRMVVAGHEPSAHGRAEMFRMGNEKVLAFSQSWLAMWTAWWLMPLRLGLNWRGAGSRVATTILGEGLAPIHKTATANVRRLTRRSRSRR
jgi:hypothetical protein